MAFNVAKMQTQLQGTGQTQRPEQSSNEFSWRGEEGGEGTFQPYILPHFPVNLWDRDIMTLMGVYLYSPNARLLPSLGLGEENEGRVDPTVPNKSSSREGLGYF